ncbi:hypothetical protein [Cerasicoccus frondis]|uniref:hypothetical protein n=1 Tax=Cerasicoccus frondis TaxID=490090 RepID=UPI0028525895|nr:hypothetical protein [Cerasicoccus frondis]
MAKIIKRTRNGVDMPLDRYAPVTSTVNSGKAPTAPAVPPPIAPPTILEMTSNFAGAMLRFAKSGFKTVDEPTAHSRLAVCRSCEFWDEKARKGLGKCKHSKCGCTIIKHYLATEKCPLNKW